MSRSMSLTSEQIEQFVNEFRASLNSSNFTNGDIKFQKSLPKSTERAKIYFTPTAWVKQAMLLDTCDKEVAWHGVTERLDGQDGTAYLISDIVVYPQRVTAASVDMDPEKYAKWIQDNDEDERFNHLRMQGHSHVNMGVTPSGTDVAHQKDILQMVGEDSFYIFMIYNKRREFYVHIFDRQKNLEFEKSDVDVYVADTADFLKEISDNVLPYAYSYTGVNKNSETQKVDTKKNEQSKKDKPKKKNEPEGSETKGEKPIVKFGSEESSVKHDNACDDYDDYYGDWYDLYYMTRGY